MCFAVRLNISQPLLISFSSMILMSSFLLFFFYSDTRYISLSARFTSNFLHLVADNVRDNFKSRGVSKSDCFFFLICCLVYSQLLNSVFLTLISYSLQQLLDSTNFESGFFWILVHYTKRSICFSMGPEGVRWQWRDLLSFTCAKWFCWVHGWSQVYISADKPIFYEAWWS